MGIGTVGQPGGVAQLPDFPAGRVQGLAHRAAGQQPFIELNGKELGGAVRNRPQGSHKQTGARAHQSVDPAAQLGQGPALATGMAGVEHERRPLPEDVSLHLGPNQRVGCQGFSALQQDGRPGVRPLGRKFPVGCQVQPVVVPALEQGLNTGE